MTKRTIVDDALALHARRRHKKLEAVLAVMTRQALNEYEAKRRDLDNAKALQNNSLVAGALAQFLKGN